MENIVQTQKVLKNKSEIIPDLEDALREATQRYKEADKARVQKFKADELKKELAWAHVAAKQEVNSNSSSSSSYALILTHFTGVHGEAGRS